MKDGGPEDDIILTSRIRIARNLQGVPFPILQTDTHANEVIESVNQAIQHAVSSKSSADSNWFDATACQRWIGRRWSRNI